MNKDHKELWEECCRLIKETVPPEQYNTWFQKISSVSFQDQSLKLLVPSAIFMDQLEERYLNELGTAIHKVYGNNVKLYYVYSTIHEDPSSSVCVRSSSPSSTILAQSGQAIADPFKAQPLQPFQPQLNPQYNFSNYCVGASNNLAYQVAMSIASKPAVNTFNPLFVFGPIGVGKTHLIQAIGIHIKEKNPAARVLYITARLFENQFTTASLAGDTNNFFHFYQSIDTLIIDDIQDLLNGNKKATQNIFFHIFNHLQQNGRQIILSSDTAPSFLDGFEIRLLSRFKSGMSVELEVPDYELRRKILIQKAEQEGLDIPENVIDYIAENITESIRDLVGVTVSLIGRATVLNCDISLDLAKDVVKNAVKIIKKKLTFDTVVNRVADFYGLEPSQIIGKSRKREISDARQIVMYLAKKHAKMPVTTIAAKIDRTYPTVIYSCHSIEERLDLEKKLRTDLAAIEATLR